MHGSIAGISRKDASGCILPEDAEGIAMKSRSETIWRAYAARFRRTHIQAHSVQRSWAEREGWD